MIKYLSLFTLSLLFLLLVTSCGNRRDEIGKQLKELYTNTIYIPSSELDTIACDSSYMYLDPNYQILVYIDSMECTPCYASRYQEWEYILKECRKYNPSISLTIIIETKNLSENVREKFLISSFSKTVLMDKEGAFRKRNPFFPESEIMHVFLLDKGGRVILVGNPLNNKKIEELLYSKLGNS